MHSMKTGYIFFWFPLKFAKDYIEQLLVFSLIKGKSIIIQYPISTNNWYDTSFWSLFEIQDSKNTIWALTVFIWTHLRLLSTAPRDGWVLFSLWTRERHRYDRPHWINKWDRSAVTLFEIHSAWQDCVSPSFSSLRSSHPPFVTHFLVSLSFLSTHLVYPVSLWVTGCTWRSSDRSPQNRHGRTQKRTAWRFSKWALSATSTSSSRLQSCRASCWWGMAWRSSGSPTEVSLPQACVL